MKEDLYVPFPAAAELSDQEFELAVRDFLTTQFPASSAIQHRSNVHGPDGVYNIDVLVEFYLGGFLYRTLVECKKHKSPLKRDYVQVLHQRLQSTGSQKGVIFSTSPFQAGAIKFASAHGIALVRVVEGEAMYENRSVQPPVRRRSDLSHFAYLLNGMRDERSISQRTLEADGILTKLLIGA